VREVAELHVGAMADPAARGERIIVCSGDIVSLHRAALMLKARHPDYARRVSAKVIPDWLLRPAASSERITTVATTVTAHSGAIRRRQRLSGSAIRPGSALAGQPEARSN
jgi:nucleoside-diphosphate-sugar epimerase